MGRLRLKIFQNLIKNLSKSSSFITLRHDFLCHFDWSVTQWNEMEKSSFKEIIQ